MKKLLLRIGIGLVVLVVVAVLAVSLFLDGAVKTGIETVGSKLTKVDIKLDGVSLSLLSGSGTLKGLVVGNPEGFKTPQAIKAGSISLALKPSTIFSDKLVIKSINLQAPDITLEGGLSGNNLSKILANVEGSSGEKAAAEPKGAGKKLEVDDFIIANGKVTVSLTDLGGRSATVSLPEIHLTNLGTGPDGITAADLSKKILGEVLAGATQVAKGAVADLGKNATELGKGVGKDLGKTAGEEAGKVSEKIGNLFKKK